jgi:hypothetical protein
MNMKHIALVCVTAFSVLNPLWAESEPKRPFFRLTSPRERIVVPAPPRPTSAPVQEEQAVAPPPEAHGQPSDALAAEREKEMFGKMDSAVQQIAGLYGNPRFVRLMTNDPSAADQFKARLDLTAARGTLEDSVADLSKQKAALDADIAIRAKTLAAMDERLIRARAALDAFGKAGSEMTRMIEQAAE